MRSTGAARRVCESKNGGGAGTQARSRSASAAGLRLDRCLPSLARLTKRSAKLADPTINDWVMDLRMNLNRLESIVEEVEGDVAEGNLDGAALVLSTQAGKIGRFTESYGGLQGKLREEGADPERVLKS